MFLNNKKSSWMIFFILVLVLGLLLSPIQGQKKTVIKYWLWLDDPTDPMFPDLVKQFNSLNPDIQVEYELIPLSQYHDKLVTAIGAGVGPDAARFKDWWLGEFVDAGALEPLDIYLKAWPGQKDVIPNLWNTGKISAKSPVYMMPHQFITFYLYYRKDWFKEKNLPPPTDLAKFLDAAKKLTNPSANRYGFGLRGGAGGQDQWLAFIVAQGARLVDRNGKVIANSPEAVLANQWYIDLFRVHKVAPPSAPTDAYAQIIGAFQAGITAMVAHHVGSSVLVTQKLGAENVGVVPMPPANPKKPATMATMSGNVIFSGSKNKEAAFKFISWLTEKEPMEKWSRSKQGQLPVLRSVAALPFYTENIFFKTSLDQAKYAITWPPLPGVGYVSAQLWQTLMQRALLGEITSKEMMDEIAAALQKK
ncbi:MAG: ABC transporter substrate-binding protein [Dictyoglomaceae bacterium]